MCILPGKGAREPTWAISRRCPQGFCGISSSRKALAARLVVAVGGLGVALSYAAIYVLLAYFAAGIVWWANLALLLSGPMAGLGAALAWRQPRQTVAAATGLLAACLWLLLWFLMLTVFGFRFQLPRRMSVLSRTQLALHSHHHPRCDTP